MNARLRVARSLALAAAVVACAVPLHAEGALPADVESLFQSLARPLPPCPGASWRAASHVDQSRPRDCLDPVVVATGASRDRSTASRGAARVARPARTTRPTQPRARLSTPLPAVAVTIPAPVTARVPQALRNTHPDPILQQLDGFRATPEELAEFAPQTPQEIAFGDELGLPVPAPGAVCDFGAAPSLAACLAVGGSTPEVAALRRLACLADALHRYKLAAIACAQQRVDQWQATVIWPRTVLDALRTGTLARVATLREHAEALLDEWRQPESTAALAAPFTTPQRLTRRDYERAFGVSRGPERDQAELVAWLSVSNRNTLQARTSAAFGLAGELPEGTWERIGREGSRVLAESRRDPLAAIRHTPQMLADRLRVDTNTARLEAQALLAEQILRDQDRARRQRERALGWALLRPLLDAAEHERRFVAARDREPS